jgi:hypothetical protein
MVLLTVAALAAGWIAIAVVEAARGMAGRAVGIPLSGFTISRTYTLVALQGPTAALGAESLTFVVLAGPAALLAIAITIHFLAGLFRTPGWLRGLALELAVLALLWIPSMVVVAVLAAAGGPVAELYRRLGEPQAGRWGAAGLGCLALWLVARVVAGRTIATAKGWMRTDGLGFRRRLVRVVAGYPAAVALGTVMTVANWAPPLWSGVWVVAVFGVLVARTP